MMAQQQQQQPAQNQNSTAFTVAVKTTDKFGAGTDANVYVQIQGTQGKTEALELKESINHKDKFERNCTDVFFLYNQPRIGEVQHLSIWHDNSGPGPSWHLEAAQVHDQAANMVYTFPCNQWLARDEGDGQIARVLRCTQKRQKMPKHLRPGGLPQMQQQQQQPAPQQVPQYRQPNPNSSGPVQPLEEKRVRMWPYYGGGGYGGFGGGYPYYPYGGFGYRPYPMYGMGYGYGMGGMGYGGMGGMGYGGYPMFGFRGHSWSWSWSW